MDKEIPPQTTFKHTHKCRNVRGQTGPLNCAYVFEYFARRISADSFHPCLQISCCNAASRTQYKNHQSRFCITGSVSAMPMKVIQNPRLFVFSKSISTSEHDLHTSTTHAITRKRHQIHRSNTQIISEHTNTTQFKAHVDVHMPLIDLPSYTMCRSARLPLHTVRCRDHVAIVDQHSAAIEPIKVAEARHPRELVHAGRLTTNDSRRIVALATT